LLLSEPEEPDEVVPLPLEPLAVDVPVPEVPVPVVLEPDVPDAVVLSDEPMLPVLPDVPLPVLSVVPELSDPVVVVSDWAKAAGEAARAVPVSKAIQRVLFMIILLFRDLREGSTP
jgi:hypothetical protein